MVGYVKWFQGIDAKLKEFGGWVDVGLDSTLISRRRIILLVVCQLHFTLNRQWRTSGTTVIRFCSSNPNILNGVRTRAPSDQNGRITLFRVTPKSIVVLFIVGADVLALCVDLKEGDNSGDQDRIAL